MPERIDGLSRADIRELFETYARAYTLKELRELALRDERFRRPAFHAMLRQEHLRLPKKMNEEDRRGILRKFHLFFRFLHHDVYRERVQEILGPHPPDFNSTSPSRARLDLLQTAHNASELVLAVAGELYYAGMLPPQSDDEGPFVHDRAAPEAALRLLAPAAAAAGLADAIEERLRELPATRNTLAACLEYGCARCGYRFPAIHRYYVRADPPLSAADLAADAGAPSCPSCGGDQVLPGNVVADETTGELDTLLASACIIDATPHRLLLAPPLTIRREEHDRILEIRFKELEDHCQSVLGTTDEGAGMLMYNIVYSRDELAAALEPIASWRAMAAPEQHKQLNELMASRMIEEVIRKVQSGVLPLDMAVEHVQKFARANPELAPPVPLYSDTGGDPEAYLTAVIVTKTIYEEREEAYDIKALLALMAAEAYDRVGATGLAEAEFNRAARFRELAGDSVSEMVDELLASRQTERAMREGRLDVAIEQFEALLRRWPGNDEPATLLELERTCNALGMRNHLGVAYERAGRARDALRSYTGIDASVRACLDSLAMRRTADGEDAGYADQLLAKLRYIQSGVIANQGSLARNLAYLFAPMLTFFDGATEGTLAQLIEAAGENPDDRLSEVLAVIAELLGMKDVACSGIPRALLADAACRYARALEISEAVAGHSFAAIQANAVFELHRELGDATLEELERWLGKALAHAREVAAFDIISSTLASFSRLREESGDVAEAARLSDETLHVLLRSRVAAGLDEQRRRFGTTVVEVAARSARLHLQLGDAAKAIEAIESAKCSLLSLELERASLRLSELDPADPAVQELNALIAARRRLRSGAVAFSDAAARFLPPEARSAEPVAAAGDLDALDERIETLRHNLRVRHPRFDAWCRWSSVVPFHLSDLERVAATWREPVRIIGFLVSSDTLWWYTIGNGSARAGSVPLGAQGAERLSAMLVRVRGRIARESLSAAACAELLGEIAALLAPAFAFLDGDGDGPILLSPHDSLLWLPWPLLPVGGKHLVEVAPLYVVPGLSILAPDGARPAFPADPALLVVADPQQGGAGALPEAAGEARMLAERFRRCVVLEGRAATVDALIRNASGKDILHFCCHGSFGGFGEGAGQLLLAADAADVAGADALTSERIVESFDLTGTALVNLAACESGLVRPEQGTEIDGITRAFLCAGAKLVLGSLWPLHDRSARLFSERFYTSLEGTRDPGRALWQAQTACLRDADDAFMAKPKNWAAYILVGAPEGGNG